MDMQEIDYIKQILARDQRLIRLQSKGKAIFVGDTHGDLDATETIFRHYFKPGYILIFLGDYIDRGPNSRDNIEFLLEKKVEAPQQIFLLSGNHEAYCLVPFRPADFWESLSPDEYEYFSDIFKFLPFAAITENGIIALHAAIPDVNALDEINSIQICSEQWLQLSWGDFGEATGELISNFGERPKFGKDYFMRVMNKLGKNVLIRAHQPNIKPVIFDRRCLTLMTSYSYTFMRLIAVVDLEKPVINTVDDIKIVEI